MSPTRNRAPADGADAIASLRIEWRGAGQTALSFA
jgi:hypothetical protein